MVAEPPAAPPLSPFGLVLHHDGSWTHEGVPVQHPKLRAAFDRSVRYLPDEGKYVVQLGRFRGEIEIEEAAFFVRMFDAETGAVSLSDRSQEVLDLASLHFSRRDGALLCRVKRELLEEGLLARFQHAAQAEFMNALDDSEHGRGVRIAGTVRPLPDLFPPPGRGD